MCNLVGIRAFDKKALAINKSQVATSSRITDTLAFKGVIQKHKVTELEEFQQAQIKFDLDDLPLEEKLVLKETIEENERRGQFTRIYPTEHTHAYHQYFEHKRYLNYTLEEKLYRIRAFVL